VISADIAAMAPGTHIGAAHPVAAGGKEMDETLSDKIVNDLAALAKTVAEKRGRNIQWAEKAVRESVSVTETEALEKNVIDLTATDINDLIRQINGLNVAGKGILRLDAARRVIVKETLRTKVLKIISDPNIAYILLMLGLAGIYFELANPGAVLPGVVGGISLILAFFALQTLPVDVAGVLLILAALVFFLLEIKIASYGMLSLAGVASFLLGSLMLFETPSRLEVSLSVVLPTALLACGFFVVVAALVFKAQRSKPTTGSGGLVGEVGVARSDIDPAGKVFVHGELWRAVSDNPVKNGEPVRVIGVNRLVLSVTPVHKDETIHKENR
jgi:membrane-bound serine protease (ClpP class)